MTDSPSASHFQDTGFLKLVRNTSGVNFPIILGPSSLHSSTPNSLSGNQKDSENKGQQQNLKVCDTKRGQHSLKEMVLCNGAK